MEPNAVCVSVFICKKKMFGNREQNECQMWSETAVFRI